LKPADKTQADKILEELEKDIKKPPKKDMRQQSWISAETWLLIDRKAEARRIGQSELVNELKGQVKQAVNKDRRARAEAAAALAENYLKGGEVHEAYAAIQGWYRGVTNKPPKPTHRDEESVRREYETLFTRADPEGEPIPIHIEPTPINDEPPNENEVVKALKRLRLGKSPGASGIRAEDLRRWHRLAREPDEDEEPLLVNVRRWEKILKLLNLAFTAGEVPKAFCNGILVLIPKSSPGEYRGIALLEIIYKLMSTIINSRLARNIKFDDDIHGFRAGRGTGTAIMEAKLRMQLHTRTHTPLYMIFMDLK
jgi:hypothetical protein